MTHPRTLDLFGVGADPTITGTRKEQYSAIRAQMEAHRGSLKTIQDDLNSSFQDEMRASWKEQGFKGEFTVHKFIGKDPDKWNALKDEGNEMARASYKVWSATRDELNAKLDALAIEIEVDSGPDWNKAFRVCSSDYATQGFGACTYARSSAERREVHYATYGLETEVRVIPWREKYKGDSFLGKSDLIDYEVWVKASKIDIEITRRKPGMSVKDFLKWSWSHGVNPRVYDPFIPTGLEDQLGIDYFGNDRSS